MAERALDRISTEATAHMQLVDQSIAGLEAAVSRLQAMGGEWTSAVDFIDAQVVANPTDEEWLTLQAKKDKMVADFLAMRDTSIAVKDAAVAAR